MTISDEQILKNLQNDHLFDKGFGQLVSKYQEQLYWHIRRIVHFHEDADDVIQNVFIKVFRNIKGFKGESKLYTWMYRIASNESLNYIKKNRKIQAVDIGDFVEELENKLRADEYFDGDEAQLQLVKAIEHLPEKQKRVFQMRYYDEVPYKEMSEILDTSIGALKASYHHAVKKIEEHIKLSIDNV